jgi:hypothetical protein
MDLLFRPRADEILHRLAEWIEHWLGHLDNSYYFRPDVVDEIFEFEAVK